MRALGSRRERSRLTGASVGATHCFGCEPSNKFEGQGGQIVVNPLWARCRK